MFAESLDPVRSSGPAGAARIHAELDLQIALLMGLQVVLPEPYSFDSRVVLAAAGRLLAARSVVRGAAHSPSPVREPFILPLVPRTVGGRRIQTFREMLAFRMDQGRSFILSAWPELQENPDLRRRFAAHCAGDRPLAAIRFLKDRETDLAALDALSAVFASPHATTAAAPPDTTLEGRIAQLIEQPLPRWLLDQHGPALTQLQEDARCLRAHGVSLSDRSAVRQQAKAILGDERRCRGVVELVDSCYNEVVFEASGASTGAFSTAHALDHVAYLECAQEFARSTGRRGQAQVPQWHGPLELTIAPDSEASVARLCSPEELWAVVTDGRVVESVFRLRDALAASGDRQVPAAGRRLRAEEAFDRHVDLVATLLGRGKLATRRGTLLIELGGAAVKYLCSFLGPVGPLIEPIVERFPKASAERLTSVGIATTIRQTAELLAVVD